MEWPHTVWPEAKLVYTALPKVANTSIKSALLDSYLPQSRRRSPHDGDQPYVATEPRRIRRDFPDFCHFAVVRDPFDRLVSFWNDRIARGKIGPRLERLGFHKEMPFPVAVRKVCEISDRRADPHFRSQTALLVNRRSELRIDLALRFERLEEEWNLLRSLVASHTGSDMQPLPHRRASKRRHAADYYFDDATTAMVIKRYATDFNLLGYPRVPEPRASIGKTDDDVLGILLDRHRGASVLDLSAPSAARAARVVNGGGRYLGAASRSSVGQLVNLEALSEGRVPMGVFDVLVVNDHDLCGRSRRERIRDQFEGDGRTVLTESGAGDGRLPTPRTASRQRWTRYRSG